MSSILGVITGNQPQRVRVAQRIGSSLNTLLNIEATLNENHLSELDVTDHPVEVGSDISDHIRLRPNSLELTAFISNRPVAILASQNASLGVKGGSPLERAEDAFREMLRWQSEGLLLTVVTTLRTYEDMVLQRVSPTRDASSGKVLRAQLSFREIITVETQIVDISDTERPQDQARKDKGRKTKQPASAEVEASAETNTSLLARGVNSLFGP